MNIEYLKEIQEASTFKIYRLSLGLSQEKVAADLMIDRSHLSRIERNPFKYASTAQIIKLGNYLNVSEEELKEILNKKISLKLKAK